MAAKKKPADAEPERPGADAGAPPEQGVEQPAEQAETPVAAEASDEPDAQTEAGGEVEAPAAETSADAQAPAAAVPAGEVSAQAQAPAAPESAEAPAAADAAEAPAAAEAAGAPAAEQPAEPPVAAGGPAEPAEQEGEDTAEEEGAPAPRAKPAVPGAHLEVDIVPEGVDPLGREEEYRDPYAIEEEDLEAVAAEQPEEQEDEALSQPIASATIDLAAGARYRATGKRKTAIARVTLRPGSGTYVINGRTLEEHFPRVTLQRNIRQPLETVGYEERMDVVARLHGGGISAQAGALRHGVSRALLEADPNLRGELKRRGFLTRDSRAKERKKAGLKKARKRPQFSKR
jgi:small subunit ribosomal protein S9